MEGQAAVEIVLYGGEIGAAVVHLERVAIAVDEMQQASGVAGRKA